MAHATNSIAPISFTRVLHDAGFALASDDFTDQPGVAFPRANKPEHRVCLLSCDHHRHPDAHVEDLIEFRLRHASPGKDYSKNRKHLPRALVDDHITAFREYARDVINEAAACDVSETLDRPRFCVAIEFLEERLDQRTVADMHLEQLVA